MYAVSANSTAVPAPGGAGAGPLGPAIAAGPTAVPNNCAPAVIDGVSQSPWQNPAANGGVAASPASGGFFGVIAGLIDKLGTLIAQLGGGPNATAPAAQNVADATFASKGDPHLSETGTLAGSGNAAVNTRFDSMSSHADLLDAQLGGGYRLATIVTDPNAKGVTLNASASVQLDDGRDSVSLAKDGSYAIQSGGAAMSLAPGERLQLSGGATVSRAADGSLLVHVADGSGASIDTTLGATGGGVNVTASAHDVTVGGDIVAHSAIPAPTTAPPPAADESPLDASLMPTPSIPAPIAMPALLRGS